MPAAGARDGTTGSRHWFRCTYGCPTSFRWESRTLKKTSLLRTHLSLFWKEYCFWKGYTHHCPKVPLYKIASCEDLFLALKPCWKIVFSMEITRAHGQGCAPPRSAEHGAIGSLGGKVGDSDTDNENDNENDSILAHDAQDFGYIGFFQCFHSSLVLRRNGDDRQMALGKVWCLHHDSVNFHDLFLKAQANHKPTNTGNPSTLPDKVAGPEQSHSASRPLHDGPRGRDPIANFGCPPLSPWNQPKKCQRRMIIILHICMWRNLFVMIFLQAWTQGVDLCDQVVRRHFIDVDEAVAVPETDWIAGLFANRGGRWKRWKIPRVGYTLGRLTWNMSSWRFGRSFSFPNGWCVGSSY